MERKKKTRRILAFQICTLAPAATAGNVAEQKDSRANHCLAFFRFAFRVRGRASKTRGEGGIAEISKKQKNKKQKERIRKEKKRKERSAGQRTT